MWPINGAPDDHETSDYGGVVTPGLIDAHTHTPWAGTRHHEYAARVQGATSQELQAAGGGILATHQAVAQISFSDLNAECTHRLRAMLSQGETTVECKSGYGFSAYLEAKQLLALHAAAAATGVPHGVPTFLGLHALPKGADRMHYVADAIANTSPRASPMRMWTSTPSPSQKRAPSSSQQNHWV